MSNKVAERNEAVVRLMRTLVNKAKSAQFVMDQYTKADLDSLFSTKSWGFRELLLVVAIARMRDESYLASQDLYACNPRPLFENAISVVMDEELIPRRQSGPLNVAKGVQRLNRQWAAGRSPQSVAEKFLEILDRIEAMDAQELENFTTGLLSRFLQEATAIKNLAIEPIPNSDVYTLHDICLQLIVKTPDYGNTPQRIIGYLLQAYHYDISSNVSVKGHYDRASTTSTTSHKVGDITESILSDTPLLVYEVTVKKFGQQRINEAYKALKTYDELHGIKTREIHVICRSNDVDPAMIENAASSIGLGKVTYQDVIFHFVDIYEWIMAQLLRMTPEARIAFHSLVNEYISQPNTAIEVKNLWRKLHQF